MDDGRIDESQKWLPISSTRILCGPLLSFGIRYTMISREHIYMIIRMCCLSSSLIIRYILLVNLVFTSLPVIFMGAFDQDVSAEVAMKVPQLYMRGILRKEWGQLKFWYDPSLMEINSRLYMGDGLYQSAVCYFFPFLLYYTGGFVTDSGLDLNSTSEIGVFVACGTITIVNLYILLNQQHWDWLFLLIVALSVLSVWA